MLCTVQVYLLQKKDKEKKIERKKEEEITLDFF